MSDEPTRSQGRADEAARRKVQRKHLDERGVPKDDPGKGRNRAALEAGAGEPPDGEPRPIPAAEVSEPNPTRIGER